MLALSPHHLWKFGLPKNLVVGGATVKSVVSVRNLEAHFDTHMSTQHKVDAVCKKCNFHLRCIKSITSRSVSVTHWSLLWLFQIWITAMPSWVFLHLVLHISLQFWWICIGCLSGNASNSKYYIYVCNRHGYWTISNL